MPNRVKRNSVVELLQKVPVTGTRGSLLTAIDKLLKTIDISESAVMIPTLLRDKCAFDAWELLIVAKILKASILGHSDLVEFYMNHIGLSAASASTNQPSGAATAASYSSSASTMMGPQTHLSPSVLGTPPTPTRHLSAVSLSQSPALSPSGAFLSFGTTPPVDLESVSSFEPKSGAWFTAQSHSSSAQQQSLKTQVGLSGDELQTQAPAADTTSNSSSLLTTTTITTRTLPIDIANNNHVVVGPTTLSLFTDTMLAPIHTPQTLQIPQTPQTPPPPPQPPLTLELRPNRSAGCLSRANSGSSSPRASQTPVSVQYPQAETLVANAAGNALPEDPGVSVRLLLQIEQLKSSIQHVTSLLENVVELYKKSVDSIAMA